jgi:hypothetical protein
MQSFSLLSKAYIEKCVSEEFEAGGCKWYATVWLEGRRGREKKIVKIDE